MRERAKGWFRRRTHATNYGATQRFCLFSARLLSYPKPGRLALSPGDAMLVVMHSHATPQQVEQVLAVVRGMNLTPHPLPGATRTAIGITGNVGAVDPRLLEVQPGVLELIRVTKPYKLASREMHEDDTRVRIPLSPTLLPKGARGDAVVIGPGTFTIIAGPCSVENED